MVHGHQKLQNQDTQDSDAALLPRRENSWETSPNFYCFCAIFRPLLRPKEVFNGKFIIYAFCTLFFHMNNCSECKERRTSEFPHFSWLVKSWKVCFSLSESSLRSNENEGLPPPLPTITPVTTASCAGFCALLCCFCRNLFMKFISAMYCLWNRKEVFNFPRSSLPFFSSFFGNCRMAQSTCSAHCDLHLSAAAAAPFLSSFPLLSRKSKGKMEQEILDERLLDSSPE